MYKNRDIQGEREGEKEKKEEKQSARERKRDNREREKEIEKSKRKKERDRQKQRERESNQDSEILNKNCLCKERQLKSIERICCLLKGLHNLQQNNKKNFMDVFILSSLYKNKYKY